MGHERVPLLPLHLFLLILAQPQLFHVQYMERYPAAVGIEGVVVAAGAAVDKGAKVAD